MMLNITSQKLVNEMVRIANQERDRTSCNVDVLINALFNIRDEENDFANLFYIYFEKKLQIKKDVIDKAISKIASETKEETSSEIKLVTTDAEVPTITIECDDELKNVIMGVNEITTEKKSKHVTPDYFMVALFETESQTMRRFLKEINANYMEAKTFFEREKILKYEIVPYELSSFVRYRNPDYKNVDCDIVGRDKELKQVYRIMLKSSKRNVIIYGDAGVGKTAVGEKFTYEIANGLCPEKFANFKVLELSVRLFCLACENESQANEKMNALLDFLGKQKDDIILLIDEIQIILGKAGLFENKKMDLSTTFKPILARGDLRIIGITTRTDYTTSFATDATLSRRFEGVEIKQPKYDEVYEMILPRVRKMEKKKGVLISNEAIEQCIWYAACFEYNKSNPDKSIDVVDRAMANAELEDRTTVTKDDIVNVFRISFKRWEKMTETVKLSTAYHEAAHYVVARITDCGTYNVLAVSIYPTDEYDGVNVFEYDDESTSVTNRKYYLDGMATDLAGRAAEEIIFKEITSGATADICNATAIAKEMIMEYGLGDKVGKNRYYEDFDMGVGTGDNADEISEEVDRAIDEAYKLANKYLMENRDYLDAVAMALMDHQILMKNELDQIWKNVTEIRMKMGTSSRNSHKKKDKKDNKIFKYEIKDQLRKGKKVAKYVRKEIAKMFK